jgi:hypothetical protein
LKDIKVEAAALLDQLFVEPLYIWPGFEQSDESSKILKVKKVVLARVGLLKDNVKFLIGVEMRIN